MKYYYHATPIENTISIEKNGLQPGAFGLVYLTEKPEEAVRFPAIEHPGQEYMVFKVKIPKADESKVEESFDHCYEFWKCRCFSYEGAIPAEQVQMFSYYDLRDKGGKE